MDRRRILKVSRIITNGNILHSNDLLSSVGIPCGVVQRILARNREKTPELYHEYHLTTLADFQSDVAGTTRFDV